LHTYMNTTFEHMVSIVGVDYKSHFQFDANTRTPPITNTGEKDKTGRWKGKGTEGKQGKGRGLGSQKPNFWIRSCFR